MGGMSGRSRVQTTLSRDSPSQKKGVSVPDNTAAEVSAELPKKCFSTKDVANRQKKV